MKKILFKMQLNKNHATEYQKRTDSIWPELQQQINASGVISYSIFLGEESNVLFAFQELSEDPGSQAMGNELVVRKRWDYMADLMQVNPDNSPVSVLLKKGV
ncbi:MAG: L-rhamnose mutarotase [Cyclobacteriaceae bacterium]